MLTRFNPEPNHEMKIHPDPFDSVMRGDKTAEFRKNDRQFCIGDKILLNEYDPDNGYTGASCLVEVTHIQKGYGIPEDHVMLSIRRKGVKEVCPCLAKHKLLRGWVCGCDCHKPQETDEVSGYLLPPNMPEAVRKRFETDVVKELTKEEPLCTCPFTGRGLAKVITVDPRCAVHGPHCKPSPEAKECQCEDRDAWKCAIVCPPCDCRCHKAKVVDMGSDAVCNTCNKRFCPCPERQEDGSWKSAKVESGNICSKCGGPKHWEGTLCESCREQLTSKAIYGDRYNRSEEHEWRKALLDMLRPHLSISSHGGMIPDPVIDEIGKRFLS